MKAKDQRLKAKWSALPGLISRTNIITDSSCACSAREMFSVRKHGYRKAKLLAIRARHAGLPNME